MFMQEQVFRMDIESDDESDRDACLLLKKETGKHLSMNKQ